MPEDVAPGPVPERAYDVVLQPVVGPEEVPGEAAPKVVEDIAARLAADDGPARPAERARRAMKALVDRPVTKVPQNCCMDRADPGGKSPGTQAAAIEVGAHA
jgi:hypothetical protein